ncbi:hypothetical protein QBC41DRAFT_74874 [Cercophora samala]|uniref:Uncharacterized protein n=1 Tax=Cercophora samala TaxID=330535 RepID=A0AA39ZGG0_9PEZI|nr:hypothetical protein QBC41DRAFT_74874 [Cercophora samala]
MAFWDDFLSKIPRPFRLVLNLAFFFLIRFWKSLFLFLLIQFGNREGKKHANKRRHDGAIFGTAFEFGKVSQLDMRDTTARNIAMDIWNIWFLMQYLMSCTLNHGNGLFLFSGRRFSVMFISAFPRGMGRFSVGF